MKGENVNSLSVSTLCFISWRLAGIVSIEVCTFKSKSLVFKSLTIPVGDKSCEWHKIVCYGEKID